MSDHITQVILIFEARIAKLTDCIATLRTIQQEEKLEQVPAVPPSRPSPLRATPRPAKAPKHVKGGHKPKSELRTHVEEWATRRGVEFIMEEMPAELLVDRAKTSKLLQNLKSQGFLVSTGRGRYVVAGGQTVRGRSALALTPNPNPAPGPAPKYNPSPNGAPVLDGKLLKERAAKAARYIIGLHKGKALGALALIEECRSLFPQLVESENRIQDFRVALIDAAQAGLLTRIGKGPDAVYCDPVENS